MIENKIYYLFDLLPNFLYKEVIEREDGMNKIRVKKSVKKSGKPRKTKIGNGVCLTLQMQVSITDEMGEFINLKAEQLNIKYPDYVRSLILKEMLREDVANV